MNLSKTIIEKFIKDPDWKHIEEYIVDFFDNDTDIQSVNTDLASEVVHAQVIAKQQMGEKLAKLIASFDSTKGLNDKLPVSYK